ncbi:hypothetical protein RhiJN_15887 [Ceratobasidium sp. AG-Ba]|nr:hypothetical protein RhiJN_15887 [Ceratobasidium sp. AG-Ba]
MDEHVAIMDQMATIPDLIVESIMDHQMLPEEQHLHDQVVAAEVLGAPNEPTGKREAITDLSGNDSMASGSIYQQTATDSDMFSTHAPEVGESVATSSNPHDYVVFDDTRNEYISTDEAHPTLDETGLMQLVKDLAREAEMETEPSIGPSTADGERMSIEREAAVDKSTLQTENMPKAPGANSAQPGTEPLRRMDDETIPVTEHQKDSIIDILDTTQAVPATEAIKLHDAGKQTFQGDAATSTEVQEVLEFEITSETPQLPAESKTVYLEHIEVVGADTPLEDVQPVTTEDEAPGSIQIVIESTSMEEGPAAIDTEELQAAPIMETEPISAISTEFAIENDPALETATPTSEEALAPVDPPSEPNLAPLETDTVLTATAAVAAVIEPGPQIEQPVLGAGTDADADADSDQAEHMRRAEQTRLEQDGGDAVMQQPDTSAQETSPQHPNGGSTSTSTEPIEKEVAPIDDEPLLSKQLEQGQAVTAGPIDPVIVSDPTLSSPNGNLSPHAPQHSTAFDAPSAIPPSGMFDAPKSPEWQGFAALGEESPEPADHSSEAHEGHADDSEPKDPNTSQLTPPESTSVAVNSNPKRKLIMEVVIPVSGNSKGKSKAAEDESPRPVKRGRPKSKPASSTRSNSTSKSRARSRSSGRRAPAPVSSSSAHRSSAESTPEKITRARTRSQSSRRPLNIRSRKIKKPGKLGPAGHIARSAKVEVVMQKRPGLLRRTGSIASGNNVKFAPTTRSSKKRKAESEPDEDETDNQAHDSDVDAEGEVEEGYEDVEDDEGLEPEPALKPKPKPKAEPARKAAPSKPTKRPRRSLDARKTPTKLPEVLTDSGRLKKRRVRR